MTSVEEDQRAHLVEAQKSFIKLRISNQIWRRGLIMQPSCKIFWSSVCNSWEACLWFTKNPCPEQSKNSSLSLKRSCSIKFQRSISNNTNKEMWVQVRGEVEKVYLPPYGLKVCVFEVVMVQIYSLKWGKNLSSFKNCIACLDLRQYLRPSLPINATRQ